jgi:hypothetical protein
MTVSQGAQPTSAGYALCAIAYLASTPMVLPPCQSPGVCQHVCWGPWTILTCMLHEGATVSVPKV